jgi:tRNA (mo5U34)-methyltransferase
MSELFYARVIERAAMWHAELRRIKADNPPQDFTWYGYDILSNLWHIEGLLGKQHGQLLDAVRGQPLADIGAADGDLAYFFERQGFDVDVLDWPATNWNGLRGARRLHTLLESTIGIHEVDLDS